MFILSDDWNSEDNPMAVVEAHRRYEQYLEQNRQSFPASAFAFASADWHYNFNDHKALHDSWLVDMSVRETNSANSDERVTEIQLKLLGAFHDGHLRLTYHDVRSYQIGSATSAHTSIDRDEVRLSENGYVLHEIVWWQDVKWLIECTDISCEWIVAND